MIKKHTSKSQKIFFGVAVFLVFIMAYFYYQYVYLPEKAAMEIDFETINTHSTKEQDVLASIESIMNSGIFTSFKYTSLIRHSFLEESNVGVGHEDIFIQSKP